jgi:DNA modification methylase
MNEISKSSADEINEYHRLANQSAQTAIEYAILCGEKLIEKKASLQHGEWEKYVRENLIFNPVQAWKYSNLARNKDAVLSNLHSNEDFNIDNAMKYLSENSEKYGEVADRIKKHGIKPQSEINESHDGVSLGDVYLINDRHRLIIGDATDMTIIPNDDFDCVLTDPPYGINYKSPTGSGLAIRGDYGVIVNDDIDFDPDILFEYSDNVITWGANHYANRLNHSPGWIVWDKRDGEQINNNSDCEMAWTNMLGSARLFHHKWNGFVKDSEQGEKRIHPTQKPVKLFMYCLEMCKAGDNVVDLYGGSGTTLIACNETDRTATVFEIDPVYGAAMLARFKSFGYSVVKI